MVDQSNGWVIVAIPRDDDPVWKVSSEKIPHMTLLFLGDVIRDIDPEASPTRVVEYMQHVANTSLAPFDMSVDHRGPLGPKDADVLFFRKSGDNVKIPRAARHFFLEDDLISKAYNSVEQYPEWTPHLTLGYPETPAKKPDDDRELSWVQFDKIALWTGDYEGPTFKLEYPWDRYLEGNPDMSTASPAIHSVSAAGAAFLQHKKFSADKRKQLAGTKAMSDGSFPIENASDLANAIRLAGNAKNPQAARKHIIARAKALGLSDKIPDTWNSDGTLKHSDVDTFLEHFGVKGMHWGVRKRQPVTSTTVSSRGGKIKKVQLSDRVNTQRSKPSADATRTAVAKAIVKKHSTDSLSNEELKALNNRMQLENQYKTLKAQQITTGSKFVDNFLKQQGQQAAQQASKEAIKRISG